jgi:YjbR
MPVRSVAGTFEIRLGLLRRESLGPAGRTPLAQGIPFGTTAWRTSMDRRPHRPIRTNSRPAVERNTECGVSSTDDNGRVRSPIEVPEDILKRVSAMCLALPEVTVRVDGSLTSARSTAHSFDIRRRSFCLLVARQDPIGKPVPLLVLRADPDELDALLSMGHPFFAPRAGRNRIGIRLTDDTDWEEIRELLTESYQRLAPKKLTRLLDWQRGQ